MKVKDLIYFFSTFSILPVEIEDIRDHLVEHGISHRIRLLPFDCDPKHLIGMFAHYGYKTPYGDEVIYCDISYCSRLPIEWQRLVCCKEMVHILDEPTLRTKSKEDLKHLIKRLVPEIVQKRAKPPAGLCRARVARGHVLSVKGDHVRDP